jgi:hypothetical protein
MISRVTRGRYAVIIMSHGTHTTRSEVLVAEIEPLLNAEVPATDPFLFLSTFG